MYLLQFKRMIKNGLINLKDIVPAKVLHCLLLLMEVNLQNAKWENYPITNSVKKHQHEIS